MSNKKYFWLRLKADFFSRHDIRILEELPNGKEYVLFYLKLITESIAHEGNLRFSNQIPYNEQMLSVVTNTNIDIVRSAVKILVSFKLIKILSDETIYLTETKKMIGEATSTERVRKHRENKNIKKRLENEENETLKIEANETDETLHCNESETKLELELELELNKDKNKQKEKPFELSVESPSVSKKEVFEKPSIEQIIDYGKYYFGEDNYDRPEATEFFDYYESNGWKIGGKAAMKKWEASVRNWHRRKDNFNSKR